MDDPRFTKLFTDPKFRNVPKKEKKVKIDQRFQSLFKDKKFVSKVNVDKRGRPGNFSTKENYEKFYQMDSSDSSDDDEDDKKPKKKKSDVKKKPAEEATNVDYARGEAFLTDSSSGEDSSDEEGGEVSKTDVVEEEEFDKWGELDHDADKIGEDEITKRLAVCNMDWDRVGADDLFLVLSSFCPPGGRVLKVSVYPSEFGKARMAEEDQLGPQELRGHGDKHAPGLDNSDDESDLDEVDNDKSLRDMERVRKYQVNRLKYYYAVAEFNSHIAADCVYKQCDGNEYELSATRFDLRFIPDEMEFNDDPPKQVCDKAPDTDTYEPKLFSTTALSLGKVDLTWDETDPQRLAAMKKAFETEEDNGENDQVLKQFIADSSSDEDDIEPPQDTGEPSEPLNILPNSDEGEFSEEDDEKVIAKYRALLMGTEDKSSKDNLADKDSDNSDDEGMEMVFKDENIKEDEDKAVEKMTPWEKYLHKKKEKRKQKKRSREEIEEDNDDQDEDDIPSDVDLNDPFFKEELSTLKTAKADKSGKKKRKKEEKNNVKPNDLELLTMDSDDDKKHFDYKEIVDNESKSKKKRMNILITRKLLTTRASPKRRG